MKRVLTFIKDVLKGIVVGLANVIPGVSGGTMMVAMGIYDKLISAISHLFSKMKEHFFFLLAILIGMAIAILGGSVLITNLFDRFPFPTTLFFIGLILGSLPMIWSKLKGEKKKPWHFIAFAIFFALVIGMALLSNITGHTADLTPNFKNMAILFLVGFVAAGTMVIPGVSGSMVLLVLGYYDPVLSTVKGFIEAIKNKDMAALGDCMKILLPFGIGVLLGIVLLAKLIEWIFKKFETTAYWAILGLIVASPIGIIMMSSFGALTAGPVIAGVVCLIIGGSIAFILSK